MSKVWALDTRYDETLGLWAASAERRVEPGVSTQIFEALANDPTQAVADLVELLCDEGVWRG